MSIDEGRWYRFVAFRALHILSAMNHWSTIQCHKRNLQVLEWEHVRPWARWSLWACWQGSSKQLISNRKNSNFCNGRVPATNTPGKFLVEFLGHCLLCVMSLSTRKSWTEDRDEALIENYWYLYKCGVALTGISVSCGFNSRKRKDKTLFLWSRLKYDQDFEHMLKSKQLAVGH